MDCIIDNFRKIKQYIFIYASLKDPTTVRGTFSMIGLQFAPTITNAFFNPEG